jgi:diketogulonate reductase-like aldo/keto reductase
LINRKFGWTGINVPAIGQGTWMIDGNPESEHLAIKGLRLGLDLGLTHIDTAEMYGNGRVEEIVSKAIAGRRDEVFLVSKVLPSNASYEGTMKACEGSLKRLKTDWLDLYLLHWPGSYPIKETMNAMEKLVSEGLVKFIGVSNFNLDELIAAQRSLKDNRLACNQVLYHLEYRGLELHLLQYCTENEIALVGYSPFGHDNFPSLDSNRGKILLEIAKKYGRTPRQVALNFLTRHHNIFTIPKISRPDRARENSRGVGWTLSTEDMEIIKQAFPLPDKDAPLETI